MVEIQTVLIEMPINMKSFYIYKGDVLVIVLNSLLSIDRVKFSLEMLLYEL